MNDLFQELMYPAVHFGYDDFSRLGDPVHIMPCKKGPFSHEASPAAHWLVKDVPWLLEF